MYFMHRYKTISFTVTLLLYVSELGLLTRKIALLETMESNNFSLKVVTLFHSFWFSLYFLKLSLRSE